MKIVILSSCILLGMTISSFAQKEEVLPSKSQVEWANSEIGVIITYDINVYAPETFDYSKKETLPPLTVFKPTKLNTDQWVESAKKAGARYAVLVAKHGTGFCLWKTKAYDYHVGNTPFRGGEADILADFIKSCKKYGLKPGIYYNTNCNTLYGAGYRSISDEERLKYNEIVYQQLKELWRNYGDLFEIWFDGGVMVDKKTGIADKVSDLLRKYQSKAVLFQGPLGEANLVRWSGNEDGSAPYPNWSRADAGTSSGGTIEIPDLHGNPDGKYWIPAEADLPNRKNNSWQGGWLWRAGEEHLVFSSDELMTRYYTSVGRNSNMLIGMVIDTAGLFPVSDAKVFEEFGNKLRAREKSKVGETRGTGNALTIKFNKPQEINQIQIEEDITKGERIRGYKVEALVDSKWQQVCEGTSVGHKHIQVFDKVKVSAVKLDVVRCKGEPIIKRFSTYMY